MCDEAARRLTVNIELQTLADVERLAPLLDLASSTIKEILFKHQDNEATIGEVIGVAYRALHLLVPCLTLLLAAA